MKSAGQAATPQAGQRGPSPAVLNVEELREQFPILGQKLYGKPLVYLDNAATAQKPRAVLDAMNRFYVTANSNIHRGVHWLSQEATQAYEAVRAKVQRFLNAAETREIIFVRGTTEAVNLVAQTYGRQKVQAGDEILISAMEHHSNIVPWQILCQQTGAVLRVIPMSRSGELIAEEFERLLTEKTRILALVHVSNALGTVNPIREMIGRAHARGVPVLIDGAQSVPHMPIDVRDLDCDFFAFSGHKLFGPTGVGVLYGKAELLEQMPPYQGGGDMIRSVTFEKTTYNDLPYKFEAGTPNIAGVIGLGAAVDFLVSVGMERIARYESELLAYATDVLAALEGVKLIGTARRRAGVVSFVFEGVHAHDVGTILDQEGIAVRTGHHCAQPVMDFFQIPATVRASLALYNTREEVDRLAQGLEKVAEVFR